MQDVNLNDTPVETTTGAEDVLNSPVETPTEHTPTPVENRAGANQQTINIELTDGRKIDAVRWYNVDLQKDEVQVAIDGLVYDCELQDDGRYKLM